MKGWFGEIEADLITSFRFGFSLEGRDLSPKNVVFGGRLMVIEVEVCVIVRMVKGSEIFLVVELRMGLTLAVFEGFLYTHKVLQYNG